MLTVPRIAMVACFAFLFYLCLINFWNSSRVGPNARASSIAGSLFAIQVEGRGSSIVLGNFFDKFRLEVKSENSLTDPMVLENNSLLFVEHTPFPEPIFYILKLDFSGEKIGCRRLASSKYYIGGPVAIDELDVERVLFLTGEYNPNSSGNPVISRKIAEYLSGKVTVYGGSSFSTLNRIVRLDSQSYLGVSYSIHPPLPEYGASAFIDLTDNSYLARIKIVNERVMAVPDVNGRLRIDDVSSVAALPGSSVIAIQSADYSTNVPVRVKVTLVEKASGKLLKSFLLPAGYSYGRVNLRPIAESSDDPTVTFFATSNETGELFMMSFVDEEIKSKVKIDLKASIYFNVENCSSDGMVEF